jgi:hypothetical protein
MIAAWGIPPINPAATASERLARKTIVNAAWTAFK